ncbi:MAG: hypothetical protein C0524_12815 [Rhodobacter sp.]|nr:hypothetical protein [Rhodobacter sp.]
MAAGLERPDVGVQDPVAPLILGREIRDRRAAIAPTSVSRGLPFTLPGIEPGRNDNVRFVQTVWHGQRAILHPGARIVRRHRYGRGFLFRRGRVDVDGRRSVGFGLETEGPVQMPGGYRSLAQIGP